MYLHASWKKIQETANALARISKEVWNLKKKMLEMIFNSVTNLRHNSHTLPLYVTNTCTYVHIQGIPYENSRKWTSDAVNMFLGPETCPFFAKKWVNFEIVTILIFNFFSFHMGHPVGKNYKACVAYSVTCTCIHTIVINKIL